MLLAGIVFLIGIVLLIVGKNVTNYLPPNYDQSDDGFVELMKMTGSMIKIIGIIFLVVAGIMVVISL